MGRGTGTASVEANLLYQIMEMRWEVLYKTFFDLHKAYNSLDSNQFLDILAVYIVGLQAISLLCWYWG